jgi:acyl-CoA synthetase (NDP forming)
MVNELKGCKILRGVRGEPESDVEAIVEILLRFSRLSLDLAHEITAIDINPLIVLEKGKGAIAADCLMTRTGADL